MQIENGPFSSGEKPKAKNGKAHVICGLQSTMMRSMVDVLSFQGYKVCHFMIAFSLSLSHSNIFKSLFFTFIICIKESACHSWIIKQLHLPRITNKKARKNDNKSQINDLVETPNKITLSSPHLPKTLFAYSWYCMHGTW